MARRMGFSVVGLPHYTIWHLYEPSVDDLKHMEDIKRDQKAEEEEDAKQKERTNAMFKDSKSEWEVDGAAIHDSVVKEQQAKERAEKSQQKKEQKTEQGTGQNTEQDAKGQDAKKTVPKSESVGQ